MDRDGNKSLDKLIPFSKHLKNKLKNGTAKVVAARSAAQVISRIIPIELIKYLMDNLE